MGRKDDLSNTLIRFFILSINVLAISTDGESCDDANGARLLFVINL